MKLRPLLPSLWSGSCCLVQLILPFYAFPVTSIPQVPRLEKIHHSKREVRPKGSFDNHVYIDDIGVPRGVPDEYKARNQITAGFESFLAWWATINKNVDWINYIYYNQQRFVNFTRDGFKGVASQLGATSLVAWQNRLALDMLLAERGGVCKIFGDMCCTFIPNNTAPDGSITKALGGLTMLSNELAENSGISNPFTDFLQTWFGKWSGMLISTAILAAILVTCG